jgi:hypothetical protein
MDSKVLKCPDRPRYALEYAEKSGNEKRGLILGMKIPFCSISQISNLLFL